MLWFSSFKANGRWRLGRELPKLRAQGVQRQRQWSCCLHSLGLALAYFGQSKGYSQRHCSASCRKRCQVSHECAVTERRLGPAEYFWCVQQELHDFVLQLQVAFTELLAFFSLCIIDSRSWIAETFFRFGPLVVLQIGSDFVFCFHLFFTVLKFS